jgi:hypothetical protein
MAPNFAGRPVGLANSNLLTRKPTDPTSSRSFDFRDENSGTEIAQEFRNYVQARKKPENQLFSTRLPTCENCFYATNLA